jgi:hypothetical protein
MAYIMIRHAGDARLSYTGAYERKGCVVSRTAEGTCPVYEYIYHLLRVWQQETGKASLQCQPRFVSCHVTDAMTQRVRHVSCGVRMLTYALSPAHAGNETDKGRLQYTIVTKCHFVLSHAHAGCADTTRGCDPKGHSGGHRRSG